MADTQTQTEERPTRRIEFVGGNDGGREFCIGLEGLYQLDPSQSFKLVMLSRIPGFDVPGNSPEKSLKPAEIVRYLQEAGRRADYVGYVEVPQ